MTGVLWTIALTVALCTVVAVPLVRAARRAGPALATRGEVAGVPHTAAWLPLGTRVVSRVDGRRGQVIAIRRDRQEYIVLGDDGWPFGAEHENLLRESIVAGPDLLAVVWTGSLRDDLDEYERTGSFPW